MKKLIIAGLIVGVVGLVFTSMAGATSMKGRLGLRLYGGQSWINPSDYNDIWVDTVEFLTDEGALGDNAWDTGKANELVNTTLFGGDLRYGFTDNLVLAVGYLSESGEAGLTVGAVSGATTYAGWMKQDAQLTGYTLGFNYTLMDPPGLNLYLVGGAGYYTATVKHTGDADGYDGWEFGDVQYEGESVIGYHGGLGLQWFLSSNIALDIEALYRSLTMDKWTIDGEEEEMKVDLSGPIGILSLTFYL